MMINYLIILYASYLKIKIRCMSLVLSLVIVYLLEIVQIAN